MHIEIHTKIGVVVVEDNGSSHWQDSSQFKSPMDTTEKNIDKTSLMLQAAKLLQKSMTKLSER